LGFDTSPKMQLLLSYSRRRVQP